MTDFATDRLVLRRLRDSDLEWLAELDTNPDVMRFIRAPSTADQALEDARRRIDWDRRHPDLGLWAIVENGAVHGWVGLKPLTLAEEIDRDQIELGFRLKRSSWGQGFAREAGARLLEYGFDVLRLKRVLGVAMAGNIASSRVLESLGFQFVERVTTDAEWDSFELLR